MIRRQRAGVEDRWTKVIHDEQGQRRVPCAQYGLGRRWRARYVDDRGRERVKGFDRKVEAHPWLREQTAKAQQ